MWFRALPYSAALLGACLSLGCGGTAGDDANTEVKDALEAVTSQVPDEMYGKLWALGFATQEANQPIVSKTGWVTYISVRDYPSAARHFAAEGHMTEAARAHADAASVYRQAALLSAQSIVQVYGVDPRDTDPAGADHLLTVSYAMLGDRQKALEAAKAYAAVGDDPAKAWHQPWAVWLADEGSAWPPDLSTLPSGLGPPKAGGSPNTELPVPHYELPEVGADSKRPMGDPGYLVQLALWHDGAAKEALGGDPEGILPMYRAAYRLPAEPEAAARVELPPEWILASDHLTSWDAAFMAAVTGSEGLAAVDAYKDRSFVASVAALARKDGVFDPQVAIDFAAGLRPNLMERMQAANGGNPLHQHPMWAEYVQSALMRDLAIVAGLEGDREVSGRLYLGSLDRASTKSSACPVAFMAVAAWDAENRYPTRALEFVHNFSRRYPSLKVARFSADLLGLRVSRERVGEAGGM